MFTESHKLTHIEGTGHLSTHEDQRPGNCSVITAPKSSGNIFQKGRFLLEDEGGSRCSTFCEVPWKDHCQI